MLENLKKIWYKLGGSCFVTFRTQIQTKCDGFQSVRKEDIFMQTKDAQSIVASTSLDHQGNALLPIWQQLPERSLAAFVEQDLPFQMVVTEQNQEVTRRVDAVIEYPPAVGERFVPVTEICLDPGKFSNKAGGIRQREIVDLDGTPVERDAPPSFVFINQPVVYKPAEQASYTSGPGKSTYRILSTSEARSTVEGETEGSLLPREAFSFGVDGMYKGDAIPVYNKFYQRWRLGRYQAVCYATIAKVAQEIGLRPAPKMIDFEGERLQEIDIATIQPHYLALTIALPDEEIINANGSMTLDPQTRVALQDLKGECVVEWVDPDGTAWIFKFFVVKVDLIAQTHAAWIAIFNSIDASESPIVRQEAGQTITIKGASVIDEWGGGDRQRGLFEMINGRITMFASKIEEGTHTIAEELRKSVYREFQVRPSLAQAQLALATGTIDFGSEPLQVKHLIEQLKRSRFENMLTSALVTDEVRTRFWIHVGGAAALLQEELAAFIQAAEVKPHRFLVAPKKVAPIMVLIGGWAWGYFRMKDDLRKLSQEFTQQQTLRSDLRVRLSQTLSHIPVTNGKSANLLDQLRGMLKDVEHTPEWPGYLTHLQEVDQQFKLLVPEQPWLKLPKSV
jgi:hypothetical protein